MSSGYTGISPCVRPSFCVSLCVRTCIRPCTKYYIVSSAGGGINSHLMTAMVSTFPGIVSHDMDEYRAETIIGIISIVIGIGGICKLLLCSPNGLFNNPKYMWSGLCAASALSGSYF